LTTKDDIRVALEYEAYQSAQGLCFEIWLYYEDGSLVFCSYTSLTDVEKGHGKATCRIPGDLLNAGRYTCAIGLSQNYIYHLSHISDAISFDVHKFVRPGDFEGKDVGVIFPRLSWKIDGT
jgi:hypothetical protein